MKRLLYIMVAIGIGLLLLYMYPAIINIEQTFATLNGLTHTLTPTETIYWAALPLIILVLIAYAVYKIATHGGKQGG